MAGAFGMLGVQELVTRAEHSVEHARLPVCAN
jgi:hypothetical protein